MVVALGLNGGVAASVDYAALFQRLAGLAAQAGPVCLAVAEALALAHRSLQSLR